MEKKIVVFDFDKTLLDYDSTLIFYKFCIKKRKIPTAFIHLYYLLKVFSKLKIISVKKEKEIGLYFFCPKKFEEFNKICREFSKTLKLNNLYKTTFIQFYTNPNIRLIVASASYTCYLNILFPKIEVIGTTLRRNKLGFIKGIEDHPFNSEKAKLILNKGINKIDEFYTDSLNDIYTSNISNKTFWIKAGRIVNITS